MTAPSRRWRRSSSAPALTASTVTVASVTVVAPHALPGRSRRSTIACTRSAHCAFASPASATGSWPPLTSAEAQSIDACGCSLLATAAGYVAISHLGDVLLGEAVPLRLVLAPLLVGALALPVARDRQRLARDLALDQQVAADGANRRRLAVDEGVHRPGGESERADRLEQHGVAAVGAQPRDVEVAGAGQLLAVGLVVEFDEHVDRDAVGHALQGGADGGQHAEVADHQMP